MFRRCLYDRLERRADALFELTDAVLCADGAVTTLVGLAAMPRDRDGRIVLAVDVSP